MLDCLGGRGDDRYDCGDNCNVTGSGSSSGGSSSGSGNGEWDTVG